MMGARVRLVVGGGLLAAGLGVGSGAYGQAAGDGGGPIQLAPPLVGQAPAAGSEPGTGQSAGTQAGEAPAAAGPGAVAVAGARPVGPPWVAEDVTGGGAPGCRLRKESAGYVFDLAASAAAPGRVTFGVHRDDWALAPAGSVPVAFGFDRGVTVQATGTQDPRGITVGFDAASLPGWMAGFTHDLTVTVTPGNGAFGAVPISLAGTTVGVTAMQNCVWRQHLASVPPPFTATPPVAAAVAAPVAGTTGTAAPAGVAPAVVAPAAVTPAVGAASGQPAAAARVSGCLSVTDDLQRLACYDREARAAAAGGR